MNSGFLTNLLTFRDNLLVPSSSENGFVKKAKHVAMQLVYWSCGKDEKNILFKCQEILLGPKRRSSLRNNLKKRADFVYMAAEVWYRNGNGF